MPPSEWVLLKKLLSGVYPVSWPGRIQPVHQRVSQESATLRVTLLWTDLGLKVQHF